MFGFVCVTSGIFIMDWLSRFEVRARDTSYANALAMRTTSESRQRNAHAQSQQFPVSQNGNQPSNFYFMMGGGGSPYPMQQYPAFYQPMPGMQYPGYPGFNPGVDQFLMQKYQQEYMDYLRNQPNAPMPQMYPSGSGGGSPYLSASYQDSITYDNYAPMPTQAFSRGISVPKHVAAALKHTFSRDADAMEWFQDEKSANDLFKPVDGRAVVTSPEMEDILRKLAETTFNDEQYARTVLIYSEMAERGIRLTVPEMLRWAKAAELAEDYDASVRILDMIVQNDPTNKVALREMGTIYMGRQRFSEAADVYAKLMELEPGEREWRMNRANTLTWSGRGKEAVELLNELYTEDPKDQKMAVMLAELLMSEHMYVEALPVLDALIASNPDEYSLLDAKLNALMGMHNFEDAAVLATTMLEIKPGDEKLLLDLARAYVASKQDAKSVEPYEEYLMINIDDNVVRLELANALMASEQFSEAATQFQIIVENDPENYDVMAQLANAFMAAEEFAEAAGVYSELVAHRPEDRQIALGYVTALRMSDYTDQALVLASQYIAAFPDFKEMVVQGAEIAVARGNYTLATKWFRHALKLSPSDYETRVELAKALIATQLYEEAEAELNKSLVYRPNHFDSRRLLARVLFYQRRYDESFMTYGQLQYEDPTGGAVAAEYAYRLAIAGDMQNEASKHLAALQSIEPDDITWRGDRVQTLLRRHRFDEAEAQGQDVLRHDPTHQPTIESLSNMNRLITSVPVAVEAGLLRKKSTGDPDEDHNRRADIRYSWVGLNGEMQLNRAMRMHARATTEKWKLNKSEGWYPDAKAFRLNLGLTYEGNPNWTGYGDIGYRWYRGNELKDQFLYNGRVQLNEVGGMPFTVGAFTNRHEFYDNHYNVYDNLYAYDLGVDGHYRYRKWDFLGFAKTSILTDDNHNFNIGGNVRYRLIEDPMFEFQLDGDVEYMNWRYTKDTYWSPKDYTKAGIGFVGRSYICREPEIWGAPETYFDFGYSVSYDRTSSLGHKFFLGVNRDYNKRLSMYARAEYTRESYYNELGLNAGLEYKFGGCE